MKKKFATVTYHRHDNYGAVLQCYALQEALKELNVDVEVLDYVCKVSLKPYTLTAIKKRGIFPCLMSTAGMLLRLPRKKAFSEFRKKLDLSRPYHAGNISEASDRYDGFIVGSDNVWNQEITGFDKTYFLNFVKDAHKKNSYAASMGMAKVPEKYEQEVKQLLQDFRVITTREKKTAASLSQLLNRDVTSVVDPTLLLSSEEWDKLCENQPIVGEPYILAYQMLPSRDFVEFVNQQAERYGCKAVFIPFAQGAKNANGYSNYKCGPEEWLSLFKNANAIVTDSFHGCVFSILFHKQFAIKVSQLGERIYNILSLLNLEDRIVQDGVIFDMQKPIDYKQADMRLTEVREQSMVRLKEIVTS